MGALLAWAAGIREAVAWDLSATIYLTLAFHVMLTCKGEALRGPRRTPS
jgi:hypothetical protein